MTAKAIHAHGIAYPGEGGVCSLSSPVGWWGEGLSCLGVHPCEQTQKVKVLPSRRTSYAGCNKGGLV